MRLVRAVFASRLQGRKAFFADASKAIAGPCGLYERKVGPDAFYRVDFLAFGPAALRAHAVIGQETVSKRLRVRACGAESACIRNFINQIFMLLPFHDSG